MRLLLCGLSLILLSSCVSDPKKHARTLDSWMGAPEPRLVASWGVPDSTYQSGEKKFLTYMRNYGSSGGCSKYWCSTTPDYCKTVFEISEIGLVSHWRFEGNFCH